MLFESLTFTNFFTFYGEQKIEFDLSSDNLTVIIGPNNTGKTCIIRGLEFLLYGETGTELKNYINNRKKSEISEGEVFNSSVSGCYFDGNKKIILTRTIFFEGLEDGRFTVNDVESKLITIGEEEDDINTDITSIDRIIERIIPQEMFNFFFFKGEELANTLLQQEHNIPHGLKTMLYNDKWDSILSSLEEVRGVITKELAAANNQNKTVTKHTETISSYNRKISTSKEHHERLLTEKDSLVKELTDNQTIKDTLLEGKIPGIQEDLAKLRSRITNGENDYKEKEKSIQMSIGNSLFKVLFSGKMQKTTKFLEEMNSQKLLPQEVSESLLSEVLLKNTCLCGADCSVGSSNRKKIQALKDASFTQKISLDLYSLRSFLSSNKSIKEGSIYRNEQEQLSKIDSDVTAYKKEVQEKEESYDPSHDSKIADLSKKIRNKREQLASKIKSITTTELELKRQSTDLKSVEEKLKKALGKSSGNQQALSEEKLVRTIESLVEEISSDMKATCFTSLRKDVSSIYDRIVTDSSKSSIHKDTLLPFIKDSDGEKIEAVGGGQQQVLVISYIIALSNLRRTINRTLHNLFDIKELSDQCFFMDSVYAPMGLHYRIGVSDALPGTCKQLCMLLSTQQWSKEIEDSFGEHLTNIFFLKLHSASSPPKEHSRFVQVKDKTIELYCQIPTGEYDYTTINSI